MTDSVTRQQSTGIARDAYDRVAFSLTLEGRGDNGPKAKEQVEEKVKTQLKPVLRELDKLGIKFDDKDNKASFSVVQEQRYDQRSGRHLPAGYLATYSIHLETDQVDRASEIQDRLTCVEEAQVSAPQFILQPEKRRALQKLALKEARRIVMERFQEECGVLEMSADDFEINEWSASYNDQQRRHPRVENFAVAAASMRGGAADDAPEDSLEVHGGFAAVEVSLSVGFRRKHNR